MNQFKKNIEKLNEYRINYKNYSVLDKVTNLTYIDELLEKIISRKYIDFLNIDDIKKLHDFIIELESFKTLCILDTILIEKKHMPDYMKIVIEDVNNNIIDLAIRNLKPFITDGLIYQLQSKYKLKAMSFELGNPILNENCEYIIRNVTSMIDFLDYNLRLNDIDINIKENFYDTLSSQQLAFIYGQYENFDSILDHRIISERNESFDVCEEIYKSIKKRGNNEKLRFMRTLRKLAHCNVAEGIIAMLIELRNTYSFNETHRMLINIFRETGLKYDDYDYSIMLMRECELRRKNNIKIVERK